MCKFFSCVSDGKGNLFYFNAEQRAKLRRSNPKNYEPDSHTSIADFHGYKGAKEDALNKYEFDPLTKLFTIDQINTKDDSARVGKQLLVLDFKTIIPELILKPIVNPLLIERDQGPSVLEIDLLKQWDSVGDSVEASVRDSVEASVEASVWDSVGVSVGASVGASVWVSVGASVWAYTSSFFQLDEWKYIKHERGQNPFQPCIDLWEAGLVPSFDGKKWRLHAGPKAEVVWEGELEGRE